ncbi:MAG: hypothetical protein ACPHEN_05815, partial [Candidatus Poseidoniaceae archaeon]
MTEWVSTTAIADRDSEWRTNLKNSLRNEQWSTSLQIVVDKIINDESLDHEDGLRLFSEQNLFELGRLAHLHKVAMYGQKAYF